MAQIFLNGRPVEAEAGQTVLQVALQHGVYVPHFCWHPALSVAGNCRICMVEVEGRGIDIACNMPVSEGMKVFTDSPDVQAARRSMMQFLTLNHPVDCGICDKAGECTLQDYHFAYNGRPSVSAEPKLRSTKLHPLSDRILLDSERCILCSRCIRFTREVSKSHALGIVRRGDASLVRCVEDRPFDDPYSDNIVDLCPVGALLSRSFLYKARVWYLKATPSICPGCERGCTIRIWHRKPEWFVRSLDARCNTSIVRVTPLESPVNGPWICNKARDLAQLLERPRSVQVLRKGEPVSLDQAVVLARQLIAAAKHPVALVSSWGSNEELAACKSALGGRFAVAVKQDRLPAAGEVLQDDLLIRPDKNPNSAGARALFGDAPVSLDGADLLLVWGEGFDFARAPRGAKILLLGSFLAPENGYADLFFPLSVQTERAGHYTSFAGVVGSFQPCFPKPDGVVHAEELFALLAGGGRG